MDDVQEAAADVTPEDVTQAAASAADAVLQESPGVAEAAAQGVEEPAEEVVEVVAIPTADALLNTSADDAVAEVIEAAVVEAESAGAEVVAVEVVEAESAEAEIVAVEVVEAENAGAEIVAVEVVEAESAEAPTPAAPAGGEAATVAAAVPDSESAPAAGETARQAGAPRQKREGGSEGGKGDGKRVVRTLAEGQEVTGTVKRVSEFGAFVDIGVGRDGLVHISELSVRRVGKVTDVLSDGQEVTLWIKKLDRDRNRISLTLIPPGTVTMRDLNKDDLVTGTVTRILPYGAFVDIGVGRDALLHVREMGDRYIAKAEEVVKVGEQIEARIIEIQRRRGRIDLSIKGLRPEPEAETQAEAPAAADAAPVVAEADSVDTFAEVEVLSTMEEAFRKAYAASGSDDRSDGRGDTKERRREKQRAEQEAIFERTLKQGK